MKKRILALTLCVGMLVSGNVWAEDREIEGIVERNEVVTVAADCDVLNYPGRKEGEVVGEILEGDDLTITGEIGDSWRRISFLDEDDKEKTGYVPVTVLEGEEDTKESTAIDGSVGAGVLHEGSGSGVFADAVDGVTATAGNGSGVVLEGDPIAVSSDAVLKPLGVFRITHYCSCSICCGPWADGATASGVTAVTNRTIAVDPNQIPYGSKVVINGQVYIAEDCGGAIKENCIDIYVATHQEGEDRGMYYTDVYLLED